MLGPDRAKQERLLNFAGWLHHKHRFQTIPHGGGFTEVRFTRETLGHVPALSAYSLEAGDAGETALIRDVNDLEEFGIEVKWEPATQQWVSRAAPLTDRECRALATAALYVLVQDASATPTGFHVPGAGLSVEGAELIVSYAPLVDLLVEAVRTRSTLEILHRGAKRMVDPWHVFLSESRWYLIGHDNGADQQRAFGLDAIETAEVREPPGAFEIPRMDWTQLSEAITNPDHWAEGEEREIVLHVDPRLVGRAESLLEAETTGEVLSSGWIEMSCTIRNVDAFIHRLFGLRARARVVEPPDIVQRMTARLSSMV